MAENLSFMREPHGSSFAFSAAFKRVRGVAPKEHRESAGQSRPTLLEEVRS